MSEMQREKLESAGMEIDRTIERFSGNEALYFKFLKKFPGDENMEQLTRAVEEGDSETALRAAHTLKGIALNLGFERLYTAAAALTEALRGPRALTDEALYEAVAREHAALLEAIAALDG